MAAALDYLKAMPLGAIGAAATQTYLNKDTYARFVEEISVVENQIKDAKKITQSLKKRKYKLCSIANLEEAVQDASGAFQELLGWAPTATKKQKEKTKGWKGWMQSGKDVVTRGMTQHGIDWLRGHLFNIVAELQLAISVAMLETNNMLLQIQEIRTSTMSESEMQTEFKKLTEVRDC